MNKSRMAFFERINPTGIRWEDMTAEQKEELHDKWDNEVLSHRKNLTCTCPRTFCENNHNCQFCVATHRYYGSLTDCLRIVDDKISEGVPPEKRHNIHASMNQNQALAIDREEYHKQVAAAVKADPDGIAKGKQRAKEWHDLVRIPENVKCPSPYTDFKYHGNCTKCIALHRYYNGFPYCCWPIWDKIDAAVQAYWAEQEKNS